MKIYVLGFLFSLIVIGKTNENALSDDEIKEDLDEGLEKGLELIKKMWENEKLRNDMVNIGVIVEDAMTKEIDCFDTDVKSFDPEAKAIADQINKIFENNLDPKTKILRVWHGIKEVLADSALVKSIGENKQFMKAVEHAGECYVDSLKTAEGDFKKFSEDIVEMAKNEVEEKNLTPMPLQRLRRKI